MHDPELGEIVTQESFWTGKKDIAINGVPLEKVGKNEYVYTKDGNKFAATTRGNFLSGVTLTIGAKTIKLCSGPTWYEIALSVLIFAFILVWGNIPQAVAIMPLVGGAIGGFVSALFAMLNLICMKSVKNVGLKLLIFVLFFGATLLVCWLIGLAFLAVAA